MHVGCKTRLCHPISEEPSDFDEPHHHRRQHRPPRHKYLNQLNLKLVPPPSTMSLAPPNTRTDSFNARVRGTSHIDFKTATTGVAAKSMRNEISRIVSTVDDPVAKKVRSPNPLRSLRYLIASQAFDTEMQSFFYLFTRYLTERAQSVDLYVLILSVATHPTHNHPVTGIVSNHPLKIRSSLMLIFPNQSIPKTLTSWPYSKSTVVSVPQWVRSYNRPPIFSQSLILYSRNDRCQKCP